MDPLVRVGNANFAFPRVGTSRDDVIHILVTLPCPVAMPEKQSHSKRDRHPLVQWNPELLPCPQIAIQDDDDDDPFVCIPQHDVEQSGHEVPESAADLGLYCRPALLELWNEIARDCIDTHARLWIVGPSGAGKSCAAYAFACGKVDRSQWDVLWLHAPPPGNIDCGGMLWSVKFQGNVKSTCTLPFTSPAGEIESVLASFAASRKRIVFLDGYVESYSACKQAWKSLVLWQMGNPASRRLVNVTSMLSTDGSYSPTKFPEIRSCVTKPSIQNGNVRMRTVMTFTIKPWTLAEYKAAVGHDALFQSVERALLPSNNREKPLHEGMPVEDRMDSVWRKYNEVGDNARKIFVEDMPED